jgi:predicted ATP-grasp superfamily ATP-dependent carboligase
VRVLLTDATGLTSRQVATQLSEAGHRVEVLTPDPLALTRFTRHVARLHKVPAYGRDPFGWLNRALAVYEEGGFDVLFPTQEQVAVIAAAQPPVVTAVPRFEALAQVQDKISARSTLAALGIPQPDSLVVESESTLSEWDQFPAFRKAAIGTATVGVSQVRSRDELVWAGEPYLLQERVEGPLVMAQTVFDSGRVVASTANLRLREGASGGASHKRSVDLPAVREHMERLGSHLVWHGALAADVILGPEGPAFIDINPRLVEPGNAWRAGVNLVDALLDVALDRSPEAQPTGLAGVNTHQLLLALLGAAAHGQGRRGILRELVGAVRHRAGYSSSVEELTPLRHDLRTSIPVGTALVATLVRPQAWRFFSSGAVAGYALSPDAWNSILAARTTER